VRLVVGRFVAPVGALVTFNDFEILRRRAGERLLEELRAASMQNPPKTYVEFLEARGLLGEEE
jgi:hypothetical protein